MKLGLGKIKIVARDKVFAWFSSSFASIPNAPVFVAVARKLAGFG